MMKRKVTMKEIAKKLNISISAVSLALNNKPGINEELRKEIISLCEKLGYDLRKIQSKAQDGGYIGFLSISEFLMSGEIFYTKMLHEVQEEAEKKNYHIIINSQSKEEINNYAMPHFFQKQIKGIIIAGYMNSDYIRKLLKKNIPTVLLGYDIVEPPVNCVEADNLFGAFIAVNYLIQKGHKKIGLIGGIPHHQSPLVRMQGYKMALSQANIPLDPNLIIDNLPMSGNKFGYDAAMEILKRCKGNVDAFFCVTDHYATGCIKAIQDFGSNVPEDISVMGFDNMDWVEHLTPPLTTMNIPTLDMGRAGIKRLLELIEAREKNIEEKPIKIILPVKLIERASVIDAKKL